MGMSKKPGRRRLRIRRVEGSTKPNGRLNLIMNYGDEVIQDEVDLKGVFIRVACGVLHFLGFTAKTLEDFKVN